MAELATLARPYAKAAFDYASEESSPAAWESALHTVLSVMLDPAFVAYINQPTLTVQQQVDSILLASAGKFSTAFRNFLFLLAENDRLVLIPAIVAEFEQLKAQGLNETDVIIESAYPLSQSQELLLATRLEKRFGTKINTTVVVRPELIGGVIIRAGDQVIDDSALGKLEKMRIRLSA